MEIAERGTLKEAYELESTQALTLDARCSARPVADQMPPAPPPGPISGTWPGLVTAVYRDAPRIRAHPR